MSSASLNDIFGMAHAQEGGQRAEGHAVCRTLHSITPRDSTRQKSSNPGGDAILLLRACGLLQLHQS
jgi:hypothetical protein